MVWYLLGARMLAEMAVLSILRVGIWVVVEERCLAHLRIHCVGIHSGFFETRISPWVPLSRPEFSTNLIRQERDLSA